MKKVMICLASACLLSTAAIAQDMKLPSSSPKISLTQQFATSKIELEYSRPSMKGRKVFGEMIPYGKSWRTGANALTKITFGEDVVFGGQKVAAGAYSLYTIPGKASWTVVLNSELQSKGEQFFDASKDVVKVTVKPVVSKENYETFTLDLNDITSSSLTLNIRWENVKVPVTIMADNKEKIIAYLEKELKGSNPPYQAAAGYFNEANYKLEDAITYADKTLAANPNAFWIHSLKAQIYSKLGKKKEAIASAQKAATMTKGTDFEFEYAHKLNQLSKGSK